MLPGDEELGAPGSFRHADAVLVVQNGARAVLSGRCLGLC